jgi:hypothetical protein
MDGLSVAGGWVGGIDVSVGENCGMGVEDGFFFEGTSVGDDLEGDISVSSRGGFDIQADMLHPEVTRIKNAQMTRVFSMEHGRLIFMIKLANNFV